MADALLTVENLTKSYGDKLLFDNISFGINAGQKTALIARNGYGKSTLLNILTGKTLQDSGKVTFSEITYTLDDVANSPIKYTISEDAVQHYTSKIDGNVVTNTLDKTSLPRPGTPEEPSVKTGDETPIMPFAVAMIFSASVLAGAAVSYRRRKYSR